LHARFAADATLVIEIHDAIVTAKQRNRGTNLYARRIVAMIASQYREVAPSIRIGAFFNVLDPCAIHAERNIVFFLASHRARVTADAPVLIDDEPVTHS
jgi:hypothetical protein